jgi:hypothetical protein
VFGVAGDLRPPPSLGSGDDARGIVGVAPHAGGLVFVLDVGRFSVLTHSIRPAALLAAQQRMESEA